MTTTPQLAARLARMMDKAAVYLGWYARRLRSREVAHRLVRWQHAYPDQQVLYEHPIREGGTVIDLGGYRGDFSAEMLARYRCRSFIFEPVPDYADRIRERFAHNPAARVFTAGLGAASAELSLRVAGERSSQFEKSGETVEARLECFGETLERLGISRIDLMKMNIEGGEYDLLEWIVQSDWAPRIDRLIVQFHDFVPDAEARRERLVRALGHTHEPYFGVPFVWEGWSRRGLSVAQARVAIDPRQRADAA
ncbi:MAG: FkbM family methyltransferase [Phycisphaeraceae bacterium]